MKRDPLDDFPTVEEIAASKALSRACRHRVLRRTDVQTRCLQCGAYKLRDSKRWIAPLRTPVIRRVK